MKKITKFAIAFVLIVTILSIQSPCFAQDMLKKLGRGLANVVTSVFELPKSMQESFYDDGPIGAVTYGVLDGVYKFLVRTVVGVYEIATFPIPLPADYEHIVEPEFLFSADDEYVVGGYGY